MNEFVLHRDLHVDPLTRLKNFIQFIEEDYRALFGERGLIVIFDIVGLREINIIQGREVGDELITSAASALCEAFGKEAIYRNEGDAFTVILKDKTTKEMMSVFEELRLEYGELMIAKGYEDASFHYGIYTYDRPITSIEDFYMFIVKKQNEGLTGRRITGDQLVRHILSGVVNRFRQSLEYYEEVYNYALIDEVSGLPNAKAANQYLSKMIAHTGRHTDRYSILFIDGDDLRRYNDISYETGNQMIREIAGIIKVSSREGDKVFRWLSGDEFVVILEEADHVSGAVIAERIRENIENHQTDVMYDTTVSIGVASYPIDGHDVDQIIYYAEKACKVAKERGKNRVVSWNSVDVSVF